MQKQMHNVSREMEILRKNTRNAKHCNRDGKKAFDGIISRLDMTEERISRISKVCGTATKGVIYTYKNTTRRQ